MSTSGHAALFLAASAGAMFAVWEARPHEAPSGWSYPASCCSNRDCAEVPPTAIKEGQGGVTILSTGETLAYGDTRLKDSPDGAVHVCRPPNSPKARTICLFLPPKGF
jgi:hypothetical protein